MAALGEHALHWFAAEEVEHAATGSNVAALVREHSGLLFRVAFSVVRNRAEAEDVVQDAFLRVLERERELPGIREPRPWLVRIVWNLALDRRRRIRPDQMEAGFAEALVAPGLAADVALAESGRMLRLLAAMDRLPKPERQALLLSAMEELSTGEIAQVLQRSESSVRSLLYRARIHLRERLGKELA